MSEFPERVRHAVLCAVSIRKGSVEKRPVSLVCNCALPDANRMLLAWPGNLKGDLLGKRFFARVSARMACCLALMPAFLEQACLIEACAKWLAYALASLGLLPTSESCFWGWGLRQRELQVEEAMTFAELPEKPGGIGA